MIGALVANDADPEDVDRYSRALRRVHATSNRNAARIISRANCRRNARSTRPGERPAFEPCMRETFDPTRKRVDELVDDDRRGRFGHLDAGKSAAAQRSARSRGGAPRVTSS